MPVITPSQKFPTLKSPEFKEALLRLLSNTTCLATLFLIFIGGMVTSTDSGLAVPDWPLSYGMIFPPMVGGVFYEHGHRMAATCVGFLMLLQTLFYGYYEGRQWLKNLSFIAMAAVVLQGILGGITVLYFLPTPVSVAHGVLAQTFLVLTLIMAYSQSKEWKRRVSEQSKIQPFFIRFLLGFILLLYLQLIIGAVMRHTGSGLAVPDFPTIGNQWLPLLNHSMVVWINNWRFEHNFDPVTTQQIFIHLLHRCGAAVLTIALVFLNFWGWRLNCQHTRIINSLLILDGLFLTQIILGILTVMSMKNPHLTSLHVVTGAAVLAIAVLLFLRTIPVSIRILWTQLNA